MRFEGLLEWFSGKSRDVIIALAIPALLESEALGYWKKGVARQVKASLNKQNVASRWARELEKKLEVDYKHPLSRALSNMRFGSYLRAPDLLTAEALKKLHETSYTFAPKKGVTQNVNEIIERWARANAEIAELVALLDARRPKPVIVMKTLSPTVAANIRAHIDLDVSTIQAPPMHGEWVEFEYKGKKHQVYEIVIDWPAGTQHNRSRFTKGHQCQACGHAIQNPYNWVPLLAYQQTEERAPCSLWVGRDCAEKLFGCEIEGDAIYKERQP